MKKEFNKEDFSEYSEYEEMNEQLDADCNDIDTSMFLKPKNFIPKVVKLANGKSIEEIPSNSSDFILPDGKLNAKALDKLLVENMVACHKNGDFKSLTNAVVSRLNAQERRQAAERVEEESGDYYNLWIGVTTFREAFDTKLEVLRSWVKQSQSDRDSANFINRIKMINALGYSGFCQLFGFEEKDLDTKFSELFKNLDGDLLEDKIARY